jgi:ferrous iron transport protein B
MSDAKRALRIALVGNPNTGKSSVFNRLTGLSQKVSNYPGITVDKLSGLAKLSATALAEIIDLPGTYSLHPNGEDERVVYQALVNPSESERADVVIGIADGTNLKRHLFLFTQVLDLGLPAVLVVTMHDEMRLRGQSVDFEALGAALGGVEVIPVNGRTGLGLDRVKEAVLRAKPVPVSDRFFQPRKKGAAWLDEAIALSGSKTEYAAWLWATEPPEFGALAWVQQRGAASDRLRVDETVQRYSALHRLLKPLLHLDPGKDLTRSARIDRVLTHPLWGGLTLIAVLFLLFQAVFFWAEGPMNAIDAYFSQLGAWAESVLPAGAFTELVANGIVPGVSGVLMFLPQIALLFFFIALLEESGYMARVVFMLDRVLRPFGLSGKSVVPMVSANACAIPAIMAARNIENPRERLLTILVTPFMTCSARLPVYTVLIALVIPKVAFGPFDARAFVLFALYALGFVVALGASSLVKRFVPVGASAPFLLELPRYRLPLVQNLWNTVFQKSRSFVSEAGKIILAISILLWFLANYGPLSSAEMDQLDPAQRLEQSYIGRIGHAVEPAIRPLGYDWKVGIALLSSFAAREVFVGTMATIYAVGTDDLGTVREHMAQEINPDTGEPFFNLAVGVSLMLFYAFAMQCLSTFAVVKKETGGWKWPLIQMAGMTAFAYVVSFVAYQILA